MKIFILEDDYNRISQILPTLVGHDVTVTSDIISAKGKYKAGTYDLVLLDHDLGGQVMVDSTNENTGWRFAGWMTIVEDEDLIVRDDREYPEVIVHSLNPVGAQNIINYLDDNSWTTYKIPFGPQLLKVLASLPKPQSRG